MEEYEILVETENVFDDINFASNNVVNEPTSPIKVNEEFFTEIILKDDNSSKTKDFSDLVNNYTKTKGAISISMLLSSVVLLIQPSLYLNWIGVGLVASYVGCLNFLHQ